MVKMIFGEGDVYEVDASQVITSDPPKLWGDGFPKFLAEAKAEIEQAKDALAAAERHLIRLRGEIAGYTSQTRRIEQEDWSLDELVFCRDRMGKLTSGGNDLMGRYLAVLDAITKVEG